MIDCESVTQSILWPAWPSVYKSARGLYLFSGMRSKMCGHHCFKFIYITYICVNVSFTLFISPMTLIDLQSFSVNVKSHKPLNARLTQ